MNAHAQETDTPETAGGRPISVPEVLALLLAEQASREELSYEQKLALEHAQTFARMSVEKAQALLAELEAIPRLTPAHVRKIVDVAPTHPDDVRAIFAKDRFTLEAEEIDKIINAVKASVE